MPLTDPHPDFESENSWLHLVLGLVSLVTDMDGASGPLTRVGKAIAEEDDDLVLAALGVAALRSRFESLLPPLPPLPATPPTRAADVAEDLLR